MAVSVEQVQSGVNVATQLIGYVQTLRGKPAPTVVLPAPPTGAAQAPAGRVSAESSTPSPMRGRKPILILAVLAVAILLLFLFLRR